MRSLARLVTALLLAAAAAALLAACSHTVGPSLPVSIESRRLEPSSTVPNAASICCCRVRGTIKNNASVAVNVEVRFHTKDAAGSDLGTALDWVTNIPSGGTKTYDAAGILAVCSQVSSIENDTIAYGLYGGPY